MPHRRRSALATGLIFLATAVACSSSTAPPPPPPPPVDGTGTVGAAGGTVVLSNQSEVTVPPGALSNNVTITIAACATPAVLAARGAIGQAYCYTPDGQLFGSPIEVTIFLPAAALGATPIEVVTLLTSGGAAGAAVEELTNVRRQNVAGGFEIIGNTTHFSTIVPAIANQPPTADAGPDLDALVGERVTITGGGTDPEGRALGFSWTVLSRPQGSTAQLEDADTVTPEIMPDVAGTYVLQLTVTDDQGQTATDTMEIDVTQPVGPVGNAGPDQNVNVGANVQLTGSASGGQAPVTFMWSILSGPNSPAIQNANSANASFVASAAGTYVVQLKVTDANGLTDTDTVQIVAVQPNQAPTGSLDAPAAVFVNTQVFATVTASDPDNDPLEITWRVENSNGIQVASGVGTDISFTPTGFGPHVVIVTISDGTVATELATVVLVNAMVAGNYDVSLEADASSCPNGSSDTAEGVLPVEQPSPLQASLNLEAASPDRFVGKLTGQMNGEMFSYSGPITVKSGGTTFTASVVMTGTITQDGEMDLTFTVNAQPFCNIPGSIVGDRQ
ncbi:MAG TPA: PKD domain-containing protein [Gemmatimonadota bacterium]|nr:PKD domain-containing protein [Gemmatimonadota bacterium]